MKIVFKIAKITSPITTSYDIIEIFPTYKFSTYEEAEKELQYLFEKHDEIGNIAQYQIQKIYTNE